MMTSMFSFFDAVCAESYGKKFIFSLAPTKEEKPVDLKGALSAVEVMKKEKGSESSSPAQIKKSPPQQQKRNPRFAPELDGVNCFETIIPY